MTAVGDDQLTIVGELLYVATFVAFFTALGAIAFLVSLIPWIRRRLDAMRTRNIGPGQMPLWRQAHRTGVVPEGADVDRWRTAIGKKDSYTTIQWIVGPVIAVALVMRTLAAPPRNGMEAIAHAIVPMAFLIIFIWNVTWLRRTQRLRRQLLQD